MPVNKMLIETYMKKLKMPQVAKTYESWQEKPQTIIWIMRIPAVCAGTGSTSAGE